jgi:hypothetical protein
LKRDNKKNGGGWGAIQTDTPTSHGRSKEEDRETKTHTLQVPTFKINYDTIKK